MSSSPTFQKTNSSSHCNIPPSHPKEKIIKFGCKEGGMNDFFLLNLPNLFGFEMCEKRCNFTHSSLSGIVLVPNRGESQKYK